MSEDERMSLLRPDKPAGRRSKSVDMILATTSLGGGAAADSECAKATAHDVEFETGGQDDSLTDNQGLMHLLKATIGTGVLAMPGAVRHAGIVAGPIGVALIAMVSLHCTKLLIRVARRLRAETGQQRMDYDAVAGLAFEYGPRKLRFLARASRIMLNSFMLINQLGLVAVYYLFVCENLQIFVSDVTGRQLPLIWFTSGFLLLFLPFVFLKRLRLLAPFALLANACMAIVLVCIVAFCCLDLRPVSSLPAIKGFNTLPLFLGVVLFSYESINLVLPIENKLRNKDAMVRTCGIMDLSIYLVISMYAAVGFYGYLRYGENVKEAITYSLPSSPWYMASLKLVYSFSVFVSYGLQFYLLAYILWYWLQPLVSARFRGAAEFSLRVAIVLFSFAVPMLVPHLDLMIALLGSLSGCTIIFIYPPMLHSVLLWTERSALPWWRLILMKNICLMGFGLFSLLISTFLSMTEIIRTF
ncbi:hypothetical protein BOX15_Mlig006917g2 [Macrostomum lignano]|uniref:Amino acid transporter transmembrane domain-containing protein n=1 Tax=Macrostomum lignano TaxID=282301 RepID=A0A267G6Z7_9PLAT|nr:hypothetical protein BOX15_Mlig006917g2 [Macrostomum lignano]